MLIRLRNRGQNTAEYAILIGLVIAAVVAMQTYVKRALQGRSQAAIHWMANETKEIDSQTGANLQYEPYYQESEFNVRQMQKTQTNITGGGKTDINASTNLYRDSGYQLIKNADTQD